MYENARYYIRDRDHYQRPLTYNIDGAGAERLFFQQSCFYCEDKRLA